LATGFYFDLDEKVDNETGTCIPGELEVTWLADEDDLAVDEKVRLFRKLERLRELGDFELERQNPAVPEHELQTILRYQRALIVALEHGLEHVGFDHHGNQKDGCNTDEQEACEISSRYDDLAFRKDQTSYHSYTCDNSGYLSFEEYENVDYIKSHYQPIKFTTDPNDGDACLSIGNTIQICETYRPPYHEMFVHYTARFLDSIKRVLWVGGGDSMLLHEILKYPTLELVVGLEIDQIITRSTFFYMGAQPHFENEKVQWWFGDASKSLLMLPESYFGSFDMVLVDLSETVTSLAVTEELDIMQALSLLLTPEGILVKNEHYKEQMAEIFKYRLQIHYPYVPVVCSQSMNYGSNKIDFLSQAMKEHELNSPNLFIQPLEDIEDPYEHYQDYAHNKTAKYLCKDSSSSDDGEAHLLLGDLTKQTSSPGILLIMEVDNITASLDLSDVALVREALVGGLERVGFSMVSTSSSTQEHKDGAGSTGFITILLQEGYVVARTWPAHGYCGIDFHLWSKFDLQNYGKYALLQTLGGVSSASYRIVAGGMFGVSSWTDDAKKKGPRVTTECADNEIDADSDTADETTLTTMVDPQVAKTILEETMGMIRHDDDDGYVVAIICGERPKDCSSLEVLSSGKASSVVSHVLPLMSCQGLASDNKHGGNSTTQPLVKKMKNCEKELLTAILGFTTVGKKIRAIVIDPDATYSFVRTAYKILKAKRDLLFGDELYALSVLRPTEEDSWRRNLIQRFRLDVMEGWKPNFITQVFFRDADGDNTTTEMALSHTGDELFVQGLVDATARIEERTGLTSEVKDITGDRHDYDPEWSALHFGPEHYDQVNNWNQYQSQQPVGYQTVFQLEPKTKTASGALLALSEEILTNAITQALTRSGLSLLSEQPPHVGTNQGDGCVVMVPFVGGNCVILWDGRIHVDINLFTFAEDRDLAEEVQSRFVIRVPTTTTADDDDESVDNELIIALRDVQPRGYGGVVNFLSDLVDPDNGGSRVRPIWAAKDGGDEEGDNSEVEEQD